MTTETTTARPLAYSISWPEWVQRWESAEDVMECQGLLHCIFQVQMDRDTRNTLWSEYDAQLILLLKVADTEYRGGKYSELSRAAFKQLANRFFRYWCTRRGELGASDKLSFRLIQALLHFFRPDFNEDGTRSSIPNLTVTHDTNLKGFEHAEQETAAFLDRLCEVIWEVNWFQAPAAIEAMLEIRMARGTLLDLLPKKCFEVSMYGYQDAERHWERFTERAMEKLEELALRGAESIEDSLYRGNQAALLLVAARTAHAERARRRKKDELQRQIADASKRLSNL